MSRQLPCLSSYTPYCSNQVKAKTLLDQKKQDRRVQDFLQRCIQSPFSRKLDLWNFLDIPRSRLVKYPLLLREILKHTPNDHADRQHLDDAVSEARRSINTSGSEAVEIYYVMELDWTGFCLFPLQMLMVQSLVADINRRTGESECQYYKERLLYSEEGQRDELIEQSKTLSCHGELKNNRGLVSGIYHTVVSPLSLCLILKHQMEKPSSSNKYLFVFFTLQKLHVFLFQDVLVITRSVSVNDQPVSYQLCRQPIPIRQLDLEDVVDGEMRVGGSIRGAFSNNERSQYISKTSHASEHRFVVPHDTKSV